MTQPKTKNALLGAILTVWGSIWLLAVSVVTVMYSNVVSSAWWDSQWYYTWYDDKTEVVNKLEFVNSWNQTDAWVISEMYAQDGTILVLSWGSLVTSSDGINLWASDSQVIGWSNISVWSDNITIIWWSDITISEWNDNATVLWWSWNILSWASWNTPSVLVGWAGNEISWSEWWVIVWWSWNKISWWSNSQILWWEGNELVDAENAFVAWSGVKNEWVGASFVFSDWSESFSPVTSWAFYINTVNWLWLNAPSTSWALTSSWWISVGSIDITDSRYACNDSNIWIQWVYNTTYDEKSIWCLLWCTTWSAQNWWKWDLLEASALCMDWCDDSDNCVNTVRTEYNPYIAWCNTDSLTFSIEWLRHCPMAVDETLFRDVVFDVDFVTECPSWDTLSMLANPCVYQCPEGYVSNDDGDGCVSSCTLPWDPSVKVPYGTVKTWYNISWTGVACWAEKNPDGSSKTCKDKLVRIKCDNNNWAWDWRSLDGVVNVSNLKGSCELDKWAVCSGYNLTSTWEDWRNYTWCTEYTTVWNTECNPVTKYKYDGCLSWYTEVGWVCVKWCTLPWDSTRMIAAGQSVTWYSHNVVSCNDGWVLTSCDDWKRVMTCLWNETWSDGDDPNTYKYETCVVEKVDIDPMYNLEKCPVARMASWTFVEWMGMEDWKTQIWICASQTWYTVSWGKVCEIYHRYKLTWCISWYTMSWDWCLPSCITPWSTNSWLQYGVPNAWWNNTWMAVKRWDSIKWYATTSQQCPVPTTSGTNYLSWCEASTNWTMMTCGSGWVLWWRDTYKYNSCNSLPLVYPEEYNRDERVANAECVWFQPYSTWNNVCNEDHLRWKCTRCDTWYTLNGKSLTGWDVDAKCLKDCDFNAYLYGATTPTKYTLNWYTWQILVYNANMYTCNTSYKSWEDTWKCYSGTITNTNGNVPVWSVPYLTWGNGLRQTALRPTPLVVNDGTQTWTRTIIKNWSNTTHWIANAVTVSVSGRVNPFVYYSTWANPACTPDNTYHYLKCNVNSWYVWSTTSDKCIRCEWSIPAWWTWNNNKYPSTDSITYCYSEDASLACSFKALDWYHWVPSTTGAYTKCGTSERWDIQSWYCDLDGWSTKILHWTTYPIYKPSNSTICNTECQKITAICKNGKWMSGSTEITWISYSSCSTRNWYVITYPTKKSPAAGSYNPTTGTYEKKLTSQPANTVVKEKATEYSANGLSCITGNSYFKVECPSANYYWTWNLCQPYCTWLDWSKYRQWQTVSTYDSPNPSCPTACATVTATCKADWTWNRALNWTCATQTGSKCNSSFDLTTNSDSHWLYDTCSAANGQGCYNRYHMTWCVAWYTLVAADHKCYANCTLDWKTINHWATGEWYSKSESCASAWTACSSLKQVLRCDNGTLYKNWTSTKVTAWYYSWCVNKCYDCTWTPWWTVPHLSSRTWYFSSPVSCTSASTKCTYEVRTCMNGTLQGSSSANLTGCTLTSTDNCPAESSTNKKAVSFSDVNATISSTCNTNAFSANNNTSDNTKSTCDTVVYNYYVCKSWYHFNSWKTACVQNPSCGTANWTTISSAPSTAAQRCFVWSIDWSVSTNASTYTWSCKNGVQTVSCSAYRSPTCWSANGSSYSSAPTSNLCGIWTKTSWVTTNTATYSWVCSNGSSTKDCTACKNASCGTPSWWTFLDAPSSNLCTIWSASAVTRSAAWTTATYSWSCTNSCGDSTNCSKNYTCTNTCPSWTSLSCSCWWTISSTNSCWNSCYTCNASPTCWSANGGSYTSAPTSNLCGVWIASSVTPSGSTYKWTCWNWSCNENCSASMISNCATADWYSVNNWTTASYYTAWTVSCTSASAKCSSQSLF